MDTTAPNGATTSRAIVVRSLGESVTGTANDAVSGVVRVQLSVRTATGSQLLASDPGGGVSLGCNVAGNSCSWIANPSITGAATLTLLVIDAAGNTATAASAAVII